MKKILFLSMLATLFFSCQQPAIKIACVGDSITFGSHIKGRDTNSYPAQLQKLLGDHYEVKNFGRSGATLLTRGNRPYIKTKVYKASLDFQPDLVFIMLGTNDTKKKNRDHLIDFEKNYTRLIRTYRQLPSHPRIILIKPIPAFNFGDTIRITPEVITKRIQPLIEKAAFNNHCELIDMYHWFLDKEGLLTDKVHPNAAGALRIAKRLKEYLSLDTVSFDIRKTLSIHAGTKNFHGYDMIDSLYDSIPFRIVIPHHTAKGKPWVCSARE